MGRAASSYSQEPPKSSSKNKGVSAPVKNTQSYCAAVMQTPLHGVRDTEKNSAWISRNADRIARLTDQLMASSETRPRLVVFPVLSLLGIGSSLFKLGIKPPFRIQEISVDLTHDPRLDPLRRACEQYRCYIASSCVEKVKGLPHRYFHTGFILGPEGLVLRSPKTQAPTSTGITLLRDYYREYCEHFGRDAVLPVAETPIGNLACLVEGEFLVPEAVRKLRKKGAEIIIHPTAQHGGAGQPPYMALRQSHAYTNGVYWLSAIPSRETSLLNGKQYEQWFGGGSSIIGPDGSIECELTGKYEGKATALIDPEHLRACRKVQDPRAMPADIIYKDLYL